VTHAPGHFNSATLYFRDGWLVSRTMNKLTNLEPDVMVWAQDEMEKRDCKIANVVADEHGYRGNGLIFDPVVCVFVSSFGLLNGSEWTSHQPSLGIWTLGDWLAASCPFVSTLCIDPNLAGLDRTYSEIGFHASLSRRSSILAYSILPVNLRNDGLLLAELKARHPALHVIVGGIGSESLDELKNAAGEKGICTYLPVDRLVKNTEIHALPNIMRELYGDLDEAVAGAAYQGQAERSTLDRARADILQRIPMEVADLVHPSSYAEANRSTRSIEASTVVPFLFDNSCSQNCYFCASPKQKYYSGINEAIAKLTPLVGEGSIIAFNDNDLSNDPDQTIEFCNALIAAGIGNEKHGKMRADKFRPDLLDAMNAAGFVRIAIGVESFSEDVRALLSKSNFSDANIDQNLSGLLERGMRPEINLIMFSPHETRSSLKRSVTDALQWVQRGATVYATMGVFATPNSPGVTTLLRKGQLPAKIHCETIQFPGMPQPLIFPVRWKASDEMEEMRQTVLTARGRLLANASRHAGEQAPIHVEAYAALLVTDALLKGEPLENLSSIERELELYWVSQGDHQYISI
jgi:hypothetical protein